MKKDKKTNETSVACKNKKKNLHAAALYWGQKQKKLHAANYLTLARLGRRLLPQRLAEFDGTVTNKALKGRTKP